MAGSHYQGCDGSSMEVDGTCHYQNRPIEKVMAVTACHYTFSNGRPMAVMAVKQRRQGCATLGRGFCY